MQNVADHSLNPKVWNAKYLDDKIHYDQNKKLGVFGVAYECTRDRFYSKIVGHGIDCNFYYVPKGQGFTKNNWDDSFKILLKVVV